MRGEGTGAHRQHVISFAPPADPRPDSDDSSRTLVAEKKILVVENRIDSERLHDVAEIDRRRGDLDLDLAFSWTATA